MNLSSASSKNCAGVFTVVAFFFVLLSPAGCGKNGVVPTSSMANTCSVQISGKMKDSLTSLAVSQGWAAIETGIQSSTPGTYTFAVLQKTSGNIDGSFTICASTLQSPSAIVLLALDANGKAYPALISLVTSSVDFGTIQMGSCRVLCGFQDQEQTSFPAKINGNFISSPIPVTLAVNALYAIHALDGTKNIWNIAFPALIQAVLDGLVTTQVGCVLPGTLCGKYSIALPSQSPIFYQNGGYQGLAGTPVYSILSLIKGAVECTPQSSAVFYQSDGKSPLNASPGSQLTAANIEFATCH